MDVESPWGLSLLQWCQTGRSLMAIYYEQINNCEVTDGLLTDHSGTVVIVDSGPWIRQRTVVFTFIVAADISFLPSRGRPVQFEPAFRLVVVQVLRLTLHYS